jgi:light-regulated signal transduction histidine kinase (bacteriophytochrome)
MGTRALTQNLARRIRSPTRSSGVSAVPAYGTVVFSVAAGVVIKLLAGPEIDRNGLLLLLLAPVVLAAWAFGAGPALLATTLGSGAALALFPPSVNEPVWPFVLFLLECSAIAGLAVSLERAKLEQRELTRQAQQAKREFERKRTERELALAEARAELEAFSYSISHELRAPLRGLMGFSQLLLEHQREHLDEQDKHYVARIRATSRRMREIVEGLSRLSRVAPHDITWADIDIGSMAARIAEECQLENPERHIAWTIEAPLATRGDPQLIGVLLRNLFANAVKFTSGTRAPRIEFGRMREAGEDVYYLRDNGVGFDPRYAHKLFKPFERLHDTSEFEGTGIGLATAYRIVVRHGGRIWAEGRPDLGATFFFTLGRE